MLPRPTRVLGSPHHQAGVLKADERDEEADAAGHRGIELVGNGVQNHLADADGGEREKDDAGEKDRAQSRLPGNVQLDADGVGEVGVEAHAGRERDGIARHDAHHDGSQTSREAGGRSHGSQRHPGGGQNRRVDEHDVGHGQKGGDAGQNLGAPVGAEAREFKVAFESLEHIRVSLGDHTQRQRG